ncbi:TetR/AcrR family transcriptional regulator [Roseibium litorale]|uniref:TetR/AcrR family transcriptional regulator n=1 Tax=Roseibium litorale TaxID=2803841 RepID=A0ABR9CQW0_9HYPH|nr:TetR/AcrR family transcriptional regulator [Roseibium litorale]MBD8892646.1 TetR/AcrR family transcriptional regulator [Roseibium litorale]
MTGETPLRADAQRKRVQILAAAEDVFRERGARVSLDEVAKRAGVGIGTLYRRFPTREDLLAATYSARFVAFAETSRTRSPHLDPSDALRCYLEELIQYSNLYRGFAASLGTVLQIGTPGCRATLGEGARLLDIAQKAGAVRPDVIFDDLICVATAISLATEQDSSPRPRIVHLVNVFLNGIGMQPNPNPPSQAPNMA